MSAVVASGDGTGSDGELADERGWERISIEHCTCVQRGVLKVACASIVGGWDLLIAKVGIPGICKATTEAIRAGDQPLLPVF